ncbi:restriction endonuclease subunit S, partial [Adlercreutzia sp. R7]|nr:restriction endonuclease subunit S [Adlercreutzia sp. R7]
TWEQRKLGDVGHAQSGVGFPDAEQGGREGVPFYKVSDMNTPGNETELIESNNYVTSEQIARKAWKPVVDVPAMIFAKVGAAVFLDRKRLVRKPFLLDNNTMCYSFNKSEWDTDFGRSQFERINLAALVQVGALPSYNTRDVEDIEVLIPNNLEEQRQIGSLFAKLDSLITLHQRE